jgi:hypothetical protein
MFVAGKAKVETFASGFAGYTWKNITCLNGMN